MKKRTPELYFVDIVSAINDDDLTVLARVIKEAQKES